MSKLLNMMGPSGGPEYMLPQTAGGLALSLLITVLEAGIMMLVYRMCHDSLTYNRKFNISLMMLSLASALLMTLIRNNPLFSLGALGALSICRIRTNTHDPRDLGFVFWSLMTGISSAVGAYTIGLMGSFVLSMVMLIFTKCERRQKAVTIVVRGKKKNIPEVQELFSTVPGSRVQSEAVFPDSFEMVYSLDVPKEEKEKILLILGSIEGIEGVNILAPETEVA